MISYKVKGIILAVIFSLASIMMPFSVYADTISNSNVHINYYMKSQTVTSSGNYRQIYQIDYVFDKEYVGWISSKVIFTYYTDNNLTQSQAEFTRAIYVNGGTASITYAISTTANLSSGAMVSMVQSVQNSNVVPYSELETLEDILNILQDTYNYVSIDIYDELENIVSNTSLANDYLETISLYRQWNVPFESISGISYMLNKDFPIYEFRQYNDYQFPIFTISPNDIPLSISTSDQNELYSEIILIVMWDRAPSLSTMNRYMPLTDGVWKSQERLYQFPVGNKNWLIAKYIAGDFTTTTASNNITHLYTSDTNFTPIYFGYTGNLKYVSTDFALNFGLSNTLLDNIEIIANGTTQSNSAASDLETEASEYSEIADDVIEVEEGLTSSFETSVNQIDLNTGLNGFGGNFMTSATWVRTQFDRLTENTPYGSLVVYGLTLGFVLLMLGKVLL